MIQLFNYLICLVGFPASGKSTFAQKFKEISIEKYNDFDVKIIDPDIIRESITRGEFNHKKEKLVRKKNLKEIKKGLISGKIVISDDLNYYSSMRHDLMEIAEEVNRKFFIIHIATPLKICLKWNEERGNKIPKKVLIDISNKFDDFNKYKWDQPLKRIDLSKVSNLSETIEDTMKTISTNLNKVSIDDRRFEEPKKHSNPDNERLEKITRKSVGELLKNPEFRQFKKKILELRKQFVMENLNKSFSKSEISRSFKIFLEKSLDTKIS